MSDLVYSPQHHLVYFLGTLRRQNGTRLKVFSTVSRQHVLMIAKDKSGEWSKNFTTVKITDLRPAVRLKLCC
ncbi:hypothetical protein [Acaryochloris sp. CCMEE 5410]|uniref:hypothetical protein n=1 Tax=Acaryochloris sp. CCMEE 5410 TaxID=310037 RepID=UPI0004945C37|nr:hypothetical protein [Acaryochloris sp. CCMEE 5410]KAI9129847.1 hypothetical protein ON05_032505 [Acaryochloris sp. CCMEE 5410]